MLQPQPAAARDNGKIEHLSIHGKFQESSLSQYLYTVVIICFF